LNILKSIIRSEYKILYSKILYMVSIETLEMEMKYIKQQLEEVKDWQKEILDTLNKLDDRYPTRREFNAIKRVIGILGWLMWIITAILSITK
jgi:cytochrome b subunit of formate dehydrogenase